MVRDGGDIVDAGRIDAQGLDRSGTDTARIFRVHQVGNGSALDYCLVEQALRGRHCHERGDLSAAAALPEDGDIGRITAETGDIVTDPFEGLDDVQHSEIAGMLIFPSESGKVEETERVEAMVEGDDDDTVVTGKVGSVIGDEFLAGAGGETAAVEPDHHGALRPVLDACRPYIDAEAVLVRKSVVPVHRKGLVVVIPSGTGPLRAGRAIGPACADFRPWIRILRLHEALSLGIRNALVDENAVVDISGHGAGLGLDGGSGG